MAIEAYLSAIRASPGGSVTIVIESAPPGRLLLEGSHSLDSRKILIRSDVEVGELPSSHEIKIPAMWEAGMYNLKLSQRDTKGDTCAWNGIMMIAESPADIKHVCGAQALPATLRPLPPPPAPLLEKALETSLEVRITPLVNQAVLRYRLVMSSLGDASGAFKDVAVFPASATGQVSGRSSTHVVCSLSPGTPRLFCVVAESDRSTSRSELATFSTLASAPGVCEPPSLAGRTKNSLKLRWSAPDSRGAPITGYKIEGLGVEGAVLHDTQCTAKPLSPGTTYQYRVRALNSVGAGDWSPAVEHRTQAAAPEASAQPSLCAPPAADGFFIMWEAPVSDGGDAISAYTVEIDDSVAYNGPMRRCSAAGLAPNMVHRVRVRASNMAGTGPWSEPLLVRTALLPPMPPRRVAVEGSEVSWDAPEGEQGTRASVEEYRVYVRQRVADAECEWMLSATCEAREGGKERERVCLVGNGLALVPGSKCEVRLCAVGAVAEGIREESQGGGDIEFDAPPAASGDHHDVGEGDEQEEDQARGRERVAKDEGRQKDGDGTYNGEAKGRGRGIRDSNSRGSGRGRGGGRGFEGFVGRADVEQGKGSGGVWGVGMVRTAVMQYQPGKHPYQRQMAEQYSNQYRAQQQAHNRHQAQHPEPFAMPQQVHPPGLPSVFAPDEGRYLQRGRGTIFQPSAHQGGRGRGTLFQPPAHQGGRGGGAVTGFGGGSMTRGGYQMRGGARRGFDGVPESNGRGMPESHHGGTPGSYGIHRGRGQAGKALHARGGGMRRGGRGGFNTSITCEEVVGRESMGAGIMEEAYGAKEGAGDAERGGRGAQRVELGEAETDARGGVGAFQGIGSKYHGMGGIVVSGVVDAADLEARFLTGANVQ